ncbi:MAG: hypothetical protein AB7O57_09925 [Hyphomicrobiaceae bacterium]
MSALAHQIEGHGIATTVIGLVRLHLEKAMPPRALFVPFQLGRPLGEPGDTAFQRKVLLAALRLLERPAGAVIIEDFPTDAPGWREVPGWQPPFALPQRPLPASHDVRAWSEALAAELMLVRPWQARAAAERGRTSVGISQQASVAWPDYAATFLGGAMPLPPPGLPTAALALRFLADDLKAFYGEAAQLHSPYPASRQIDRWFWSQTVAGALLQELRRAGLASTDNALRTVAGRFLVPSPFVKA